MFLYFKIYQNDGFGITKVNKSVDKMQTWFNFFQRYVNKLTDGDIVFTMEILRPHDKSQEIEKRIVDIICGNSLPHLDTQMCYDMQTRI